MCQTPNKLSNGVIVACRSCWQCKANKVKDWAGRCIAESETSVASHAIALTYGRVDGEVHHARSSVLTYSDVQAFFKRLRSNGFPLRYLVAGEYGSTKGRAHWHLIAFWQKKVPEFNFIGDTDMCHIPEWPHGHINVQKLAYSSITYAVKYITKDQNDEGSQSHFSLSKKPPLGHAFFEKWAQKHVDAGVAPRSEIYTFPDLYDSKGKKREFFMQGVTRDNFCKSFIEKWKEKYPDQHLPNSEFIEEYQDKIAKEERERNEPFRYGLADTLAVKQIAFPKVAPDGISPIHVPKGLGIITAQSFGETWYWLPDEDGRGAWLRDQDRKIINERFQ